MKLEAKIYESNSMTYTKSLHQHDKNVTLVFDGVDLPEKFEVHFANERDGGVSIVCEGSDSGVLIPDALLSTGAYVYAWVYDTGEVSGKGVVYEICIPVIPRSIPVHTTSEGGGGKINYHVDEEDENLIIDGITRRMLRNMGANIETEEEN